MKKIFAAIEKVEEQDDGTIKVWGYASSEALDSDGETVTAEAMKAALPDYLKFGAVREMHQPSAAGTAIEAEVKEDGKTFFGAHVVDPVAVKKVQTGTYKGFSIGGKVTDRDEANKTIITGLKLVEVSLVDRPANPEAVFTMYKAEGVDDGDGGDGDHGVGSSGDAGGGNPGDSSAAAPLTKGMYHLSTFSEILSSLSYLTESATWESEYEGDNSPVPQALMDWLKSGVDIFREMAAEETAEMLAGLQAMLPWQQSVAVLEQSAATGDLAKAGAKFGADAKEKLGKAHAAIKEASDHLDSLGYKTDDEEEVDGAEDDEKKAANSDGLQKVSAELDVAKSDLAKVSAENETLKKRVKELEALPAPPKAILKNVSKAEDAGGESLQMELVKDHQGNVNEAASLIKMIHLSGRAVAQP
ncbi:MAG: HK97 family phage prohead protease [Sulfuricella sp.]